MIWTNKRKSQRAEYSNKSFFRLGHIKDKYGQRSSNVILFSVVQRKEVPRLLMSSGTKPKYETLNWTQSLICGGNSECLYIPMHDGWLGMERDEWRIAEVVREDFYKRVGYWVTITK